MILSLNHLILTELSIVQFENLRYNVEIEGNIVYVSLLKQQGNSGTLL